MGPNLVGSGPEADLCLPIQGVSRQHAELVVESDRILVIDTNSKNGTEVNGQLAIRAEIRAGDRVSFGPSEFLVEVLHPDDRALVIELAPGPTRAEASRQPVGSSTFSVAESRSLLNRWLGLIEQTASSFGGSLTEPLGAIRRALPASSVTFLETEVTTEPSIRSCVGTVDGELLAGAAARSEPWGSIDCDGSPITWCWLASEPRVGLFVVGDFEGRSRSEPLLRALVAMFGALAQQTPAGTRDSTVELRFPPHYQVGTSSRIRRLHREIASVAGADLPVLLQGETGVGKDLVAQALHLSSPRAEGPFVAINCTAIPHELLESELFGIGDRVASGVAGRRGKFLEATGGTLFLDEVAEMPTSLQVKLLRVLQDSIVTPVGLAPQAIDIRLVSATNAQIEAAMDRGDFRRDLFFRLAGVRIELPPLRERAEDVPTLFEGFLRRFSEDSGRLVRGVTIRAGQALASYPWPGNVRELEHVARWLLSLCPRAGVIDFEMLPASIREHSRPSKPTASTPALDLSELERSAVAAAMGRTNDNQVKAAELLGISRDALRRRLKRHDLLTSSKDSG